MIFAETSLTVKKYLLLIKSVSLKSVVWTQAWLVVEGKCFLSALMKNGWFALVCFCVSCFWCVSLKRRTTMLTTSFYVCRRCDVFTIWLEIFRRYDLRWYDLQCIVICPRCTICEWVTLQQQSRVIHDFHES